MHARLEIAVAGKHGRGNDIVLRHGLLHRRGQRAGIADARRAAVPDEIEAQLVQIRLQAGFVQVIGHHARTGRQRRLDERMRLQPVLDCFFGQQTGRQHDRRIARVGATGDGRNQNVAVMERTVVGHGKLALQIIRRLPKAVFCERLGEGLDEFLLELANSILSCGRFGPATLGSTVARSSSRSVE